MQCPVCGAQLQPMPRSGIEIDICPGCKGVWLDRGELEKLVVLEGDQSPSSAAQAIERSPSRNNPCSSYPHSDLNHDDEQHRGDDEYRGHDNRSSGGRRRGSWLGDLLGGLGGDD